MPLPGLYPPFVTSVTPSGGSTLIVIENLEVEFSMLNAYDVEFSIVGLYDVEYEPISEVGP